MNDLRINSGEISLIIELIKKQSISIIWDINAFYFNANNSTYKLECFDDLPEGSDYEYDEIFFCRFEKLDKKIEFQKDNPKFWYKIISEDIKIESIKIVDVIEVYPDEILIDETEKENFNNGLNYLTLGFVIETKEGFVPAFLLPSNHGFAWLDKYGFYSENEIGNLLKENIEKFELRAV